MANTIEVTGCRKCPFEYYSISNYRLCVHPTLMHDNHVIDTAEILPNCPLKQSSITITLKTKNNG